MDMPNYQSTNDTIDILNEKYVIGSENSFTNYSFYLGATYHLGEVLRVDPSEVCGIKLFRVPQPEICSLIMKLH